jgi:sarcosine oxidase, subunit gamma
MLEPRTAARRTSVLDTYPSISNSSQISLRALPAATRFVLRMPETAIHGLPNLAGFDIAMPINRMSENGNCIAARLGPDEWLLIGPERDAETYAANLPALLSSHHHTVVDISHRSVAFEISGTAAAAVINSGCPLNLNEDQFPAGSATRSLLGKSEIVLMRLSDTTDERGKTQRRYRIECWRSFGRYLHGFLAEATRSNNTG